jgi:hypothetical protein
MLPLRRCAAAVDARQGWQPETAEGRRTDGGGTSDGGGAADGVARGLAAPGHRERNAVRALP